MNKTDQKIAEYLERGMKIIMKGKDGYSFPDLASETKDRIIEIAKMIQLEEHRGEKK